MTATARLFGLSILAIALTAGNLHARTHLRVSIPSPPFGQGNPFQAPGPPNMYVAPAIFDALTFIDADGTLQPALAASWSVNPDGRTWVFNLREDIAFSNGMPFDSSAIIAALEYVTGPHLAPALFLYQAPRFHALAARVQNFRMDHNVIHYENIELSAQR